MGFNVLILEVDYGFEFKSRPELQCHGITKEQARKLSEVCRQNGIRLIPLFNCLGHQSWAKNTAALLKKHPEFDETPHIPADNKGIYCREWCPSHPDVNPVVFALLDELLDAFEADALHVGMDEVFLIGNEKCPRCKGKDVGELFAGVVNALHQHLVKEKGVEMLMWGDRLLDAGKFSYGTWEASKTGSHRAIERIPKDIIICDWHYERRADYPVGPLLPAAGLPRAAFDRGRSPDAAVASIQCARKDATRADAGRPVHRLVGRGQRRAAHGGPEGRPARDQRQRHGQADRRHHPGGLEGAGRACGETEGQLTCWRAAPLRWPEEHESAPRA